MANQVNDQVQLRDFKGTVRLTAVANWPETIVMYGDKTDETTWKATDASEITYNYHEAARNRAKKAGVPDEFVDSLARGLVEDANGDVVYIGNFSVDNH